MRYRQDMRCIQLSSEQQEIVSQALVRLGRWEEASEGRLRLSMSGGVQPGKVTQLSLDLTGEQRRREAAFRKELEKLTIQKDYRYRQIQAMREVRGETIDEIGVLVLIPESMQA